MTFPANYAVIAEDELTYVTGGSIVDALPSLMTTENWKTLGTNLVKIVGNTFAGSFVQVILGGMFGAAAFGAPGATPTAAWTSFNAMDSLNKFMQVLGGAAAVYTLGSEDTVTVHSSDDPAYDIGVAASQVIASI